MHIKTTAAFLFMSAMAFAGGDNFSIAPENFRIGEEIKLDVMTAIGEPEQKVRSIAPAKVDGSAQLYMRLKVDGSVYGIYEGKLNPVPYRHFYAFDLKANKLTMQEAMKMKFYGKRRSKPYRDEPELYFDGDRIYSPHVPVLYFMNNGEWDRLEAILAPGILNAVSNNPDAQILYNGKKKTLPQEIFPVDAGFFYAEFSAPGYFTFVDAVNIQPNKTTTLRVTPMKGTGERVSFFPNITEKQLADADSLVKVEALYDVFRKDSLAVLDTLSGGNYSDVYPPKKTFENADSAKYAAYSKAYDSLYNAGLSSWMNQRLEPVVKLSEIVHERLAEFESKELRQLLVPVEVFKFQSANAAPVAEPAPAPQPAQPAPVAVADSSAPVDSAFVDSAAAPAPVVLVPLDSVRLTFKSADGRFDFTWVGKLEQGDLAQVANALEKNENIQTVVYIQNDKPVWFFENNAVVARKHYRYQNIEFVYAGMIYKGVGHFVLPEDVLKQQEVQDWLNPKAAVVEKKDSSVTAAPADTAKKDSVEKTNPFWGDVVKVDSASFRYHGKVVGISGFYIQAKEVSQEQYRKNIVEYHLTKHKDRSTYEGGERPVHNITWNDAREYCQALGGDLPTEAQWEFAARAGGNDGFVWDALGGKADDYAVYRENAGKDQKGPQPVGSKKPNAWGIYDMAGNVAEWTRDSYSFFSFYDEDVNPTGAMLGYTKVFKGGSFDSKEKYLNASSRDDEDPRYWGERIGFRCMFPLAPAAKPEAEQKPAEEAKPAEEKTATK